MEMNLICLANTDSFANMKGFVGDVFGYIFIIAGISVVSFMALYIPLVLWRDRKTRPLSVKIKDYISDCKTFWTSKQVTDALRDVRNEFLMLFLIIAVIAAAIYAYYNWM